MGVETRLVVFAPDSTSGAEAAATAFRRVAELDSLLSDYRGDSELTAVNQAAGTGPIDVGADLAAVLATALDVAARTDGAFDVTAGPLVALWRESRRTGRLPAREVLDEALGRVGWEHVQLNPETRRMGLALPGMRLDLGGVAKGYAAAAARASLAASGLERCLVEIGGEIALGAAPPGTGGWTIEVGRNEASRRRMTLSNTVVATSGDAEQFVVIAGKRYSHVVDPRTGLGSTRGVSATVIGPDGALADALATAVTLMDAAGRDGLIRHYDAYTFIVELPDA